LQEVKLVDNFYWFLTGTIGTPARNGWHQLPGQGGFLNRYIQEGFGDRGLTLEQNLFLTWRR